MHEMMTAIEIAEPGGPEVLRATRMPRPAPASGEVLIRVLASGVNRPDCLQRLGRYPPPPGVTHIPGLEVAGEVVAVGDGVAWPSVGDRVCALVAGGGYAEYCVAPAVQCLPVPAGLTPVEAAALPETCFTVWTNVFERGGLRAEEWLLVHGGASGIGTTAIQLARAFGAHVIATAGSEEKVALCRTLGADRALDYHREDFVAAAAELPRGGVDVVLDIVGGAYLERNLQALAADGRLVVIGFLGGTRGELDLVPVLRKRLTVTGSTLRARPVAEKGRIASALRSQVWPLIEEGRMRPRVWRTLPLEQAAQAHRLMEANAVLGKLVLTTAHAT